MSANLVHTAEHSDLIGDPVSPMPAVPYEKLEEVFDDIRSHILYDHGRAAAVLAGAAQGDLHR
jgi:hypothetical protein